MYIEKSEEKVPKKSIKARSLTKNRVYSWKAIVKK